MSMFITSDQFQGLFSLKENDYYHYYSRVLFIAFSQNLLTLLNFIKAFKTYHQWQFLTKIPHHVSSAHWGFIRDLRTLPFVKNTHQCHFAIFY